MQFPRESPAAYVRPLADAACEAGPELGSAYRAEAAVVAGAGAEVPVVPLPETLASPPVVIA